MSGAPAPISATAFREGMSRLGAGVTIVATDGPAGIHGITASAVCSVTDAPPTLVVCVNRASSAHDMIVTNGVLCVSVLGEGHADLATRFGRPGIAPADRFVAGKWTTLVTGAPLLREATAGFDCRILERHTVGTHSVVIAEVLAVAVAEHGHSLVYCGRRFHALAAVEPRAAPA